jgi:hypothetical protein
MKFLFLWAIFNLVDPGPDPATQVNADPDAKPCLCGVLSPGDLPHGGMD